MTAGDLDAEQRRLVAALQAMTPAQAQAFYDQLPHEAQLLVELVAAREEAVGWRADPLSFARRFDPALREWRYVQLLAQQFRKAVTGQSKRQIWELPARYGKTEWSSRRGVAWALALYPHLHIALASYGKELAVESAVWVRDFINEHGDEFGVEVRRDVRRQDRWKTTAGGGLLATSIGGRFVGFPADGVVIDDPFKGWEEAHSKRERDRVWNWYRATVRLRLESSDAWIIVVGHRLHVDDLAARLVNPPDGDHPEDWEVVRLPAIADSPDDLLGRELGQVLEPERFSEEEVNRRARVLGSYLAAALEQQRPIADEGNIIKREWWVTYDHDVRGDQWVTSWDMKLKDKRSGDFVAGQVWCRAGSNYFLVDQLRGQWSMAVVKAAIALLQVRHPHVTTHLIENTGNGPEVMEELRAGDRSYVLPDTIVGELGMSEREAKQVQAILRRGMAGLIPQNPKGSKLTRVRSVQGLIEGGNVRIPSGRPWLPAFVDEWAAFSDDGSHQHDDQVDAATQALRRLRSGETSVATPSSAPIQQASPLQSRIAKPAGNSTIGGRSLRTGLPKR